MPTFEELNQKTEFLVEAEYVNLFARAKTYYDNHFPSKLRSENWKDSRTGMLYIIGKIDNRPWIIHQFTTESISVIPLLNFI